MMRKALPLWCSVFGDGTLIRWASQSTASSRNARCSLGHRRPPNRESVNSNRHWASGQTSRTFSAISRVTKKSRSRFPTTDDRSFANGFRSMISCSTASWKNCLELLMRFRTVLGLNPAVTSVPAYDFSLASDFRCRSKSFASPVVMWAKGLSAPKKSTRLRRVCPQLIFVDGLTSVRWKYSCRYAEQVTEGLVLRLLGRHQ